MILTANNTLVTLHFFAIKGLFFNCELHLRCGAAGDPNSQQHAGDNSLFQTSAGAYLFNYELHLRCGAAGDPNSQQHASDDGLFQNLCYLGLVYFIMNSTSGVERQGILTANITLMMTVHSITLSCFFNCELHLRCGAAGAPNSQQHADDDGLFQNLCFLGFVYLIMNSISGVEPQVILTTNNTL